MEYTDVLKFGGTSVGSAQRLQAVAELIARDGEPKVVVLSAMSGTTNSLVEITTCLYRAERQQALDVIQNMEINYLIVNSELFSTGEYTRRGQAFLQTIFTYLRSFVNKEFYPLQEKAIVAQGEIISTNLLQLYLEERGVPSTLLPALDYMRVDKDGEPDYFYIKQNLRRLLADPATAPLVITQGFICRNALGEIDNLKRGGSDYSAALVGAALAAREIQIWTDIDGVHDNDPRHVKNTRALRALSFDEAAELAYFGAKILHPSSVQPAKRANIPVRLKNTLNPADEGTLVSEASPARDFKAVAAKDGITAVKIKSSNMLLAYGFVRKVFEIFEAWKTPIDMIATSEVAISLTIDDTARLEHIVKDLERYGAIEIEHDLSIICVVGDFRAGHPGAVARPLHALREIPLRMVSYGASEHSVSLLVKQTDKQRALVALSDELFQDERS
ncbi:MAG: aspartate kinase [Odoribacteraceae bacterium]|jgi:aspartate kinase|nr:aspartate kinase [Odoribacteraceae bacterium]